MHFLEMPQYEISSEEAFGFEKNTSLKTCEMHLLKYSVHYIFKNGRLWHIAVMSHPNAEAICQSLMNIDRLTQVCIS